MGIKALKRELARLTATAPPLDPDPEPVRAGLIEHINLLAEVWRRLKAGTVKLRSNFTLDPEGVPADLLPLVREEEAHHAWERRKHGCRVPGCIDAGPWTTLPGPCCAGEPVEPNTERWRELMAQGCQPSLRRHLWEQHQRLLGPGPEDQRGLEAEGQNVKSIAGLRRELDSLKRGMAPPPIPDAPPRGGPARAAWFERMRTLRAAIRERVRDGTFRLNPDGTLDPAGVPSDLLTVARRDEANHSSCRHAGQHCTDRGPWLEPACALTEAALAGKLSAEALQSQAPGCADYGRVWLELWHRQTEAEKPPAQLHQAAQEPAKAPEAAAAPPAATEAPPRPATTPEPPPEPEDGPLEDPMTVLRRAWRLRPTRVHVVEEPSARDVGICGCGTALASRGGEVCFCPNCNLVLPACPCCGVAMMARGNGERFCSRCNLLWPG
jgi:hypothetical protein